MIKHISDIVFVLLNMDMMVKMVLSKAKKSNFWGNNRINLVLFIYLTFDFVRSSNIYGLWILAHFLSVFLLSLTPLSSPLSSYALQKNVVSQVFWDFH